MRVWYNDDPGWQPSVPVPFEGVVAMVGRSDRSSLAVEVLPFLKRPNHSKVRLRLMHESPKACFNISKVSLPVLPKLTQDLMHTLCSSTSAIPPISENRRRLMQYTHKDTCNNQTLPHPTTTLGTLIHKIPQQHTLAGNSWTTSDLRVMSIVLGLLDRPSYMGVGGQHHAPAALPPRKIWYSLRRRLGGPLGLV